MPELPDVAAPPDPVPVPAAEPPLDVPLEPEISPPLVTPPVEAPESSAPVAELVSSDRPVDPEIEDC